jgi:hypothetical protein
MLLSDVIAGLDDDGTAAKTALRLGDIVLLRKLQDCAAREGLSLGGYAAAAVKRFADTANDEEWVSLLGALARTGDPGAVYLKRALAFAIYEEAEPRPT